MNATPLYLFSHGLKHGYPPKADFYVDCRGIADVRGLPGDHPLGQAAVLKASKVQLDTIEYLVKDALEMVGPRRQEQHLTSPFTICFFCAWGLNRSPAVKNIIAGRLVKAGWTVNVAKGSEWERVK